MGFFDDFASKVSIVGQEAAKKAKELADIGRMSLKIGEEEKKLSGMFEFLGISFYEAKKAGLEEDYTEAIQEICDQKCLISELRAELSKLKNCKVCADCGAESLHDAAFCAKCGKPLSAKEPKDEKKESATRLEFCPGCGAKIAQNSDFCANCGKKI